MGRMSPEQVLITPFDVVGSRLLDPSPSSPLSLQRDSPVRRRLQPNILRPKTSAHGSEAQDYFFPDHRSTPAQCRRSSFSQLPPRIRPLSKLVLPSSSSRPPTSPPAHNPAANELPTPDVPSSSRSRRRPATPSRLDRGDRPRHSSALLRKHELAEPTGGLGRPARRRRGGGRSGDDEWVDGESDRRRSRGLWRAAARVSGSAGLPTTATGAILSAAATALLFSAAAVRSPATTATSTGREEQQPPLRRWRTRGRCRRRWTFRRTQTSWWWRRRNDGRNGRNGRRRRRDARGDVRGTPRWRRGDVWRRWTG